MIDAPLTVKQQAVKAYIKGGSAVRIGVRFGYGARTVLDWVREYSDGTLPLEGRDPEIERTTWQRTVPVSPAQRAQQGREAAPDRIYQKAKSVPWPWGAMNGSQVPWNADVIIEETWKSIRRIAEELGVDPGIAP